MWKNVKIDRKMKILIFIVYHAYKNIQLTSKWMENKIINFMLFIQLIKLYNQKIKKLDQKINWLKNMKILNIKCFAHKIFVWKYVSKYLWLKIIINRYI
jgi:hypothetical protein